MLTALYINAAITGACLILLGVYFNFREHKIHLLAGRKIKELQDKYLEFVKSKKVAETKELEKLKDIADELESEYKRIKVEKKAIESEHEKQKKLFDPTEIDKMVSEAKKKAEQIIDDAKIDADREAKDYLEAKKREAEVKIVDLVMAITKKVLSTNISAEDHKKAIEAAFMEMEGKIKNE